MDFGNDLVARIQNGCLGFPQDEAALCRLMRREVRSLLDHSGAIVRLDSRRMQSLIIGFDIAPRLVRALRLAAVHVDRGLLLSRMHIEGTTIIQAEHLRSLPLGPRLRPLASGHLLLHRHADLRQHSRAVFLFTGVGGGSPEQLEHVMSAIAPCLHRAFIQVHRAPQRVSVLLTHAEQAICRLLLEGSTNKEIARMLNKSEATVRNQLHAVFSKLRVGTRTAAVLKLRELRSRAFEPERLREATLMEHLYY